MDSSAFYEDSLRLQFVVLELILQRELDVRASGSLSEQRGLGELPVHLRRHPDGDRYFLVVVLNLLHAHHYTTV
jgi:hypothetical protein